MKTTPYNTLPDTAYWRRAVSNLPLAEIEPLTAVPFEIAKADRVATAGSCFAQHIARALKTNGFGYFITEPPHPVCPDDQAIAFNYGVFTARYGNIYTARQLLQLIQRAYGQFSPLEDFWREKNGQIFDPFRPQIQPGGFATMREYELDRGKHFAAVRRAFEESDILIFTLGLTEAWRSREDGAVFPLCPGVAAGEFDPAKHEFCNFTVDDVVADATAFIDRLRAVNPNIKLILTVSPVPLVATAAGRHVVESTTYSKSVLRVASDLVVRARPGVAYFPSYEIITGNFTRGRYFADDCRSVTEEGVSHVMRVFLKYFAKLDVRAPFGSTRAHIAPRLDEHLAAMARLVQVNCDEEALDLEMRGASARAPVGRESGVQLGVTRKS